MAKLQFKSHKEEREHILSIAQKLNIDIKKIEFFRGHDGMQGINADIYHKNKKVGYAYDDARGGEMEISAYEGKGDVIRFLRDELDKLPKYAVEFNRDINGRNVGGDPITYETSVTLASIVDAIAWKKEELKIFNREKKKGILYVDEYGTERIFQWKWPLAQFITKHGEHAKAAIQQTYDEIKHLQVDNREYLKELGINV